ncbi:MAG: bifunctional phosphopantothenoylcysteine decarboxylase/phosphopantothenate--cysteine ligase CoaBC [Chitinispirillaceae bacterium]|nr:bifunctional phosphopantothenoylcysteine decarboxylase/phosphopantothenate--cysteine ligase CoaBC [Chitinispirillaceae bacterium]
MITRIVIGITGGIAAYKIPHLIRLLRKQGAAVKVVLTHHAQPLVGSETLRTLSDNPVYHDSETVYDMDHIRLAQWGELLLIAPATANTIAKVAHGIGDNLLTTLALAFKPSQVMIAPAMNTAMWENSATQENIAVLRRRGYQVLPVGSGELACGDDGAGRMLEPEEIVKAAGGGRILSGRRLLISSGPTEEPIDPVRVITNRSSGRMGAALAQAALAMGAEVIVVSGPATAPLPAGATVIPVRTAAEMEVALSERFSDVDVCIMAAAVSDYRPEKVASEKIRRSGETLSIRLVMNDDILAGLGTKKGASQLLVGFSLESDGDSARAREKMNRKKCDLMVFNRVDQALGTATTTVTVLHRNGTQFTMENTDKAEVARALLERIAELLGTAHE